MKQEIFHVQVVLDETWLEMDQLCRMAEVSEPWVCQRMEEGLLTPAAPEPTATPRFSAHDLRRVRRMASLERDFDAVPELASLVADLEDEVAALREKLRRLGG